MNISMKKFTTQSNGTLYLKSEVKVELSEALHSRTQGSSDLCLFEPAFLCFI